MAKRRRDKTREISTAVPPVRTTPLRLPDGTDPEWRQQAIGRAPKVFVQAVLDLVAFALDGIGDDAYAREVWARLSAETADINKELVSPS